jgi:hypothetical protein
VQVQATTEAAFEMGVFTVEADSQPDLDKIEIKHGAKQPSNQCQIDIKSSTVIPPNV